MKREITVYAVIESSGSHLDRYDKVVRLFTTEVAAEKMAEDIDRSHETHQDISTEDWDTILDAFDKYYEARMDRLCNEAMIPRNLDDVQEKDEEAWFDINRKVNEEFSEWGRKYTTDHFNGKYTAENFDNTEKSYDSNIAWNQTIVKPMVLEIDDNFKLDQYVSS